MATTRYNQVLNNIDKIEIETTDQATSETTKTKLNDKLKYNNALNSDTIDDKLKSLFNSLSTNVHKSSLVTMTQNITEKITVPTFLETTIRLPATANNTNIILTCSEKIFRVYCNQLFAADQTVYFVNSSITENNGYPRVKLIEGVRKGITMNFFTSGYAGGGTLILTCYFYNGYHYDYYFDLKLRS